MDLLTQSKCIEYITREWRTLKPFKTIEPPWGVWILLYEPIEKSATITQIRESMILKTWFLTQNKIDERDPYEYARFQICNSFPSEGRWHSDIWRPEYHQIAQAGFASYLQGSGLVYLEYQWGGLCGRGFEMSIDLNGILNVEKPLWVS